MHKLAKGKLYRELRPVLEKTRLNFQAAPKNMVLWNLHIKVLYILGYTDNDKDRVQHPERQI